MQMEATERKRTLSTRNRNRKPLSDCTNSSAFNKSVTKCKSRTTNPSSTSYLPPLKTASPSGTIDRDVSVSISVACRRRLTSHKKNCNNAASNTSDSSLAGAIDLDVSEPVSAFYSGRHTKNEGKNKKKAVANRVSSRPIPKISNIWDKSDAVEGLDLPKAKPLEVPCRKKQRAVSYEQGVSKDAQLQDFIEKQKAYFKDIDEFELSEEEVESIDELD